MSAQSSPAGPVEPPERTPAAIRAELPEDLRGQFDAEDQAALDEASASDRLAQLNQVLQVWWQLAWARRSPRHNEAIETGQRLLGGEEVETFPVDWTGCASRRGPGRVRRGSSCTGRQPPSAGRGARGCGRAATP